MSKSGEKDELFLQRAKSLFDESVDGLDGATASRLNQARHKALEAAGSGAAKYGRWLPMVPAAGFAAAVLVAVVVWNGNELPTVPSAPASDFEILLTEDSFEMLEDLDFYSWLDMESEFDADTNADANVG